MLGQKDYQEKLFATVNLSEMIPEEHLLKKIDKILNLNFIHNLTKELYCKDNGRSSIDPEVFFRMQIVGYLYGIKSDRQLCEHIHLNVAFRWFCKMNLEDVVPHHSSMTRIRDRLGKEMFKRIFDHFITEWQKAGIIKGKRLIADASLVIADASINSMVERQDGDPESRDLHQYEQRYHDFKEGKKQRKLSNQTHVCKSDPDAKLVARKGYYRKLCYKAHNTIDASSRIITDTYATSGSSHECPILPERINHQLETFNFPTEEIIADRGYGSGPTYTYFREKGIRAYIPLHDDNLGEGRLSNVEFKYDKKNDRYICPNNKYLYPYDKLDNNYVKRYRVIGGHCKNCPLRHSCLPQNHKNRSRFMYRSPHQEEIDRIKKRQSTTLFKSKLIERKWKVEGIFGEAKVNHNLNRAKYRGLSKVQIQFYMVAMIQNFKRVVLGLRIPILRLKQLVTNFLHQKLIKFSKNILCFESLTNFCKKRICLPSRNGLFQQADVTTTTQR